MGYEMDELDQHLQNFVNGNELHLQDYLGCHADGNGYTFRVWAPHAQQVWLVGDFNNWDKSLPMSKDAYGFGQHTATRPRLANCTNSWSSRHLARRS